MSPKKTELKKIEALKKLKSLMPQNLKLKKISINPSNVIEETKTKFNNFYTNLKKEKEKQRKKLEKKRKLDEKKELIREKKEAQKNKLNKLKEEKRQILAQKKLVIENEKQLRKNEEIRRKQAMVFQTPILLRRNVKANMDFVSTVNNKDVKIDIKSILKRVGLEGYDDKPARLLS